jgi:hypothetical protein
MTTKLHHYVPQFYLHGFADRDKQTQVWVYERGAAAAPRMQGIKNTAAQTYYYSLESKDGTRVDLVEREFARIEADAAPVIQRWRTEPRPIITPSDRAALMGFVAITYVRSPSMRALIHEMTALLARFTLRDMAEDAEGAKRLLLEHPDFDLTLDDLRSLAIAGQDPGRFGFDVHPNMLVGQALLLVNRVGPFIARRRWALLKSPSNVDFITSDTPLSVFIQHPNGMATIGPAIGRPEAELTLPISTRLALRLSYDQHLRSRSVSEGAVIEVNRRIVAQSQRFVFAARNSKRISAMVASFPKRSGEAMFNQDLMWAHYKALRDRFRSPSDRP